MDQLQRGREAWRMLCHYLVEAMTFSYERGRGEKGVSWFGIRLGMGNLWARCKNGSVLIPRPAFEEQHAGPAAERCSRCSVPSSGKKHGEHQATEESFCKKSASSPRLFNAFLHLTNYILLQGREPCSRTHKYILITRPSAQESLALW